MNGYGALVEWYWQGKTEVLGEKDNIAWVVVEWMGMEHWWNDTGRGKQCTWRNPSHSAVLFITNLTWTDRGSNTIFRVKRLVSNSPRHDTARYIYLPLYFEALTICVSPLNVSLWLQNVQSHLAPHIWIKTEQAAMSQLHFLLPAMASGVLGFWIFCQWRREH